MENKISEKLSIVMNHPTPFKKVWWGIQNRVKTKINRILGRLWCFRTSISIDEAVKKITGHTIEEPFDETFAEYINAAKRRSGNVHRKSGSVNKDILYTLSEHIQATRVIETGVAFGSSSLVFLASLHKRPGSLLLSTDIPLSGERSEAFGKAVPEELHDYWQVLVEDEGDKVALPKALQILPEIDLCHYDSDKTPEGRWFAYPLLWEALRPGGIFISDDVNDNLAFAQFAKSVNREPIVAPRGAQYVGILLK
ncbi:MAG: class I SAM-dependent methyltransferase [Candidatus Paceibacterota bacterium]